MESTQPLCTLLQRWCQTFCQLWLSGIELKKLSRVQPRKYDTIVNIAQFIGPESEVSCHIEHIWCSFMENFIHLWYTVHIWSCLHIFRTALVCQLHMIHKKPTFLEFACTPLTIQKSVVIHTQNLQRRVHIAQLTLNKRKKNIWKRYISFL